MDTAWIQVFVLTISECVAPAGKTVCQEREFELDFLTRADCEVALEQLITLKDGFDTIIVDRAASGCAPSARKAGVFETADDVKTALRDASGWREAKAEEATVSATRASHEERLAGLKTCEETAGAAPCKIGEIIIEGATGDPVEVWRRD